MNKKREQKSRKRPPATPVDLGPIRRRIIAGLQSSAYGEVMDRVDTSPQRSRSVLSPSVAGGTVPHQGALPVEQFTCNVDTSKLNFWNFRTPSDSEPDRVPGRGFRGFSGTKEQMERGDICYKMATDTTTRSLPMDAADSRLSRLEEAVKWYRGALACSKTDDEQVSASRGVAMASWKLASHTTQTHPPADADVLTGHYTDSLKHFCLAYMERFCKGLRWGHDLVDAMDACLEECKDWVATLSLTERRTCFREMLDNLPDCRLKASGYVQLSSLLFRDGLSLMRFGNYEECFRYMKECVFPLKEADRLCEGDRDIQKEVRVLREDTDAQSRIAESRIKRDLGDSLLHEKLKEGTPVSRAMMSDVIELYQQAVTLCADKDLELEAIACSRLGRVFSKVELVARAHLHYKRALELHGMIQPAASVNSDWLIESRKFVEDYRKHLNAEEEENNRKKSALRDMETDLCKLRELDKCTKPDREFIETVLKTWPPKISGAVCTGDLPQKKLLVKVISVYHPDKVHKEEHGSKWYYLTSEITKVLTRRYTS